MNVETKLQRFSDVVRREAEAQKQKLMEELQEKFEANVEEFEKKTSAKYIEMAEDVSIHEEKKKQKKITDASSEIKKKLIEMRAKYSLDIFENIDKRLNAYFKTSEYAQGIINNINKYKGKAAEDVKVFIMERDSAFINEIAEKTGLSPDHIVTVDEDFLGGVKISLGNNRIADCTFKNKYDSEKTGFNKIRIS